ncbi:hypothetical protein JAAARDRAFT_170957 [Jaapia argillacea MUCL 33604]|uniref:Amidohydrolase-related domain-containing protein n=1 Tax=Jaapia argillacea MUCL 33604 TaxID=933084 RepID=A0A067QIT7_9AGAM|nr:hypothetical protein JAAARDRAFT_170957 [Jaapia argillacea MUCL 33604]
MLFRGAFVHCPSLGVVEMLSDHLLGKAGFIVHFAPATTEHSENLIAHSSVRPVIIPSGNFIMPTFCDLHLHAPQYLYQGTGLHLPLMTWLNEYAFKAEERLDNDPALARTVYERLAQRLLESGTGAVLLFGTIKEATNLILAEVLQEKGLRGFVGKLSMDISSRPTYQEPSAHASLSAVHSFVESCQHMVSHLPEHERLIQPVITPRFVPTCSDELLLGLGEMAESRSLWVQSHLAEAHDQVEWVKRERGVDDIHVFERNHLLTSRTIQAHCTFLDPPSLSHLVSRGTAVAHCPLSNAYFSAKPFPLREALANNVKVGLGTDIAGGYSIDIMNAMRQAVTVSRMREGHRIVAMTETDGDGAPHEVNLSIDWKESLFLATRGGAVALELAGRFEVGAPFDAQQIAIFDPSCADGIGGIDFFGEIPSLDMDLLEKWWCLGDHRNRRCVWVQGKVVFEQR